MASRDRRASTGDRARSSRRRGQLAWGAFGLGLWLLGLAWALATPPLAVPDETAHLFKATAVARGSLGAMPGPEAQGETVLVPAWVWSAGISVECSVGDPTVPACDEPLVGSEELVPVTTQVGHYPPTYYALVGWPTRLTSSFDALVVGRVVSSTATTALLLVGAWALAPLTGRAVAMTAILVAATPMVAYLGAGLNPSGLEAGAGVACWCTALLIVARARERAPVPTAAAAAFAVAAAVLASLRWTGPALLGAIVLLVLAGVPRRDLVPTVASALDRRPVRVAAAAVGVAVALSATWTLTRPRLLLLPGGPVEDGRSPLGTIVADTPDYLTQMVATFGWFDVPPPGIALVCWAALALALVGGGMALGRAGRRRTLALTTLVVLVAPLSTLRSIDELGRHFSGRYVLALAVGIPIVGVLAVAEGLGDRERDLRMIAVVLAPVALVGHVAGFARALRRYAVGVDGPLWPFDDPAWQPRLGLPAVVALLALAVVLLATSTLGRPGAGRHGGGPGSPAAHPDRPVPR